MPRITSNSHQATGGFLLVDILSSREANEAAHTLAKTSSLSSSIFYSIPDCIRGTICIDGELINKARFSL
jgi:hypothetical protein